MDMHRSSSAASGANGTAGGPPDDVFYRRGSTMSEASFINDVEMAEDEMFSGPVSESVPTSNVGFAHRRSRADSTTSFTYYEEDQDSTDSWLEDEAIIEEVENDDGELEESHVNGSTRFEGDIESGLPAQSRRRKSSEASKISRLSGSTRPSVEDPLLRRRTSDRSATSNASGRGQKDRVSQKIYIQSEDLSIVIAGFNTSMLGFAGYLSLCICTAGLAYLLLRWLPRWRIGLIGKSSPLKEAKWVVVEVRIVINEAHIRS